MSTILSKNRCKRLAIAGGLGLAAFALPITSVYAQIEEIIVIARKTEESLQDIPLSVTAISGDGLTDAGITEFPQIAALTPNFDVRSDEVRGQFAAVLNIRGQNSTTSDLTIDQAVGININGVPVTRGTNLFGNLFDIEQVEVLRGPQGTLFGKNTTGGTVLVRTNAPVLGELSGYGEVTLGNFSQADVEGVINIPLTDIAALRLGAAATRRDGYGDGTRSDGSLSGVDLADDDEEFFRASLLVEPSEALSIRINADYHDVDENGGAIRALRAAFPIALPPPTDNFFAAADFNDGIVLPHSDRPEVTADETNINATIEVDLGFADLTSVTSYRDQDSNTNLNFTPLGAIIIGQDSELVTQELRLSGATDLMNWQAGIFASDEDGNDRNNTVGRGQITAVENESLSVFAQSTFSVADSLNLTLGARWTDEERSAELIELAVAGGSIADAVAMLGSTTLADGTVILNDAGGTTIQNDADFDDVSWTAALDYKVSDDSLVYGSVSSGFRSGGIDGDGDLATEVDAETVLNYELGFKTDLADGTVRFNTSVWFSDYEDIQIQSFSLTEGVAGTTGVPAVILNNAAEATLYGFESELVWAPDENLTVTLTAGYTNGEYDEFDEPRPVLDDMGDQVVIDGVGQTFIFDRSAEPIGGPEWQFSATARYGFDVSDNTRGNAQLTFSYLDEQLLAGPEVTSLLDPIDPSFSVVDSISLLNGQVDFDIDSLGLNVAVWGTNLTDEEYFSTGFALGVFGGLASRTIGAPRQFGVRLRKDF